MSYVKFIRDAVAVTAVVTGVIVAAPLAAIGLGAAGVTTTAGYLIALGIGTSAAAADALEERKKKSKP
jgi:hypothetical protein